jgi:hypothetical protein
MRTKRIQKRRRVNKNKRRTRRTVGGISKFFSNAKKSVSDFGPYMMAAYMVNQFYDTPNYDYSATDSS